MGTIMIRKKGNASEKDDDLTVHSMASASTCTNVNTCIFQVGTRRTNGTCGWCFTGMKNSRNLGEEK